MAEVMEVEVFDTSFSEAATSGALVEARAAVAAFEDMGRRRVLCLGMDTKSIERAGDEGQGAALAILSVVDDRLAGLEVDIAPA